MNHSFRGPLYAQAEGASIPVERSFTFCIPNEVRLDRIVERVLTQISSMRDTEAVLKKTVIDVSEVKICCESSSLSMNRHLVKGGFFSNRCIMRA
jgi:hypothetical protein